MGLTLAPAPDGGLEMLATALGHGGGEASAPVPVFELPLGALEGEAPLARATRVAWRYAVHNGGAAATVDLGETEDRRLRLNRIAGAAAAADLLTAARRAQARFADAGDFEVRILQLPGLHLDALWLAGASDDVFLRLSRRGAGRFDLLAQARERLRIWEEGGPGERAQAERAGG